MVSKLQFNRAPESLQQFEWRPARTEDAPDLHALLLARDEADGIDNAGTLDSMQRELEDTWLWDRETDTLLAWTEAGELAAFGLTFVDPAPMKKRRAYLWAEVHPAHRGHDLRAFLLGWLEGRARQILGTLRDDLPGVIRVGCDERLTHCLDLYQELQFQPVRSFYNMRRPLDQPIPTPVLPAGLQLTRYRTEIDRSLMDAFNEAFLDHWNFEPVPEEEWGIWITGGDFRPDLTFLVLDGEEIASFSINGVSPEKNRRIGIEEGWIHQLGTRRPWRRRGLATALLCASMRAFQEDGLDYATLGVDTENLTGALGLYENLGFTPVKRFISLEKPLDA